jgi:hypothetical protein
LEYDEKRTANLHGWTTDELFTEVLNRSVGDRSALDLLQVRTMRAPLDDCDQKREQLDEKSDHWH